MIAAVIVAIGSYYLWQLRATGDRFDWIHDQNGYYNYLGRAFAQGRLELPIKPSPQLLAVSNPWDPAVDDSYKMQDMVLFHGRYYLYHGAGPAAMLFAPWRLITGHDLQERFALFLLCFGGFVFSCAVLIRWLSLAGAHPGLPLLVLMLLALGLCQGVPYLLNRVWVYEIAIGGGYFCISGAVFFLTLGFHSGRSHWLAASGFLFGLAVSCRPHLGLAGLIALAALVALRTKWRGAAAFAFAFTVVVAAVAAYNYRRFGNPLEFGLRYLLTGPNQNRIRLAGANILPGLYFWLACPPDLSPVFPWVRLAFRYPFNSLSYFFPPGYFIEATVGVFYLAPFVAGALFIPFAHRMLRVFLWTLLASSAAVLLFLAATGFTTQRYEVDFLPAAVLVALTNFAVHIQRNKGLAQSVLRAALAVSIVCGALTSLALGISGPYGDMLKARPINYVRIARWFSPFEQFRPLMNPAVNVAFTADFAPQPDQFRDPLIVMGHQPYRYFLFAEHSAGGLRFVSLYEKTAIVSAAEGRKDMRAEIRVTYDPQSGKLATAVNGREVAMHDIHTLVMAPAEIAMGENHLDPGLTNARFTGRIHDVIKAVGPARGPAADEGHRR